MADQPQVAPGWGGIGASAPSIIKPKKLSDSFKGFKVVLHGREETFKTGSALLFPKPEILDLELGSGDLAPFYEGKDITLWDTIVSMKEMNIGGKMTYDVDKVESLLNFEQAFGEAIRGNNETIIVDSATELYDWAQEFMKREGKGLDKKQIMSSSYMKLMQRKDVSTFDFGISNTIMHDTIMKGLSLGTPENPRNFILISQDEQVWENNQPTDKYKMSGHKKVSFWMPIRILMTMEFTPDRKTKNYYGTIEKFRGTNASGEKQLLMTVSENIVSGKKLYTTKIIKTIYEWLLQIKEASKV